MGKAAEREAQRRERQRRLRGARLQELVLGYLLVPGALLTVFGIVGVAYGVWMFAIFGDSFGLIVSAVAAVSTALFGWLTFSCGRRMTMLKHRIEQLSYAPSAETGPLPPAEVLLRGADQPGGQPAETLLRAAMPQETLLECLQKEELLRATEESK
jgi:hypothetical protein